MPCAMCHKPDELCLCSCITPCPTKTQVLILQHPREPRNVLSSAQIAHLSLTGSALRIGLSWPSLAAAWGSSVEVKEWLILYLGSAKLRLQAKTTSSPLVLVDRKGSPLPSSPHRLQHLKGVVVLDGNWRQVKSLWWRNPWLLKLQRGILAPPQPSSYQQLRREPRRESLATIEALALVLSLLEQDKAISTALLKPFYHLLQHYRP